MIARLAIAALLLGHALIHVAYVAPRPPATAGGPAWPFELGHSWLLDPLGVGEEPRRLLGLVLVAVVLGSFALAALAALGFLSIALWAPAIAAGAVASMVMLTAFFHPWLVLGIAIDVVVLWAALVARWVPETLA